MRPLVDYCDIIYDQLNNESFCGKIERTQCNNVLAITGAITSQTKLYKKTNEKTTLWPLFTDGLKTTKSL